MSLNNNPNLPVFIFFEGAGPLAWFLLMGILVVGLLCALVGLFRARHALRKQSRELEDTVASYHTLFENPSNGIFFVRPGTREVCYANPVMLEMFGYSREEMERLRGLHVVAVADEKSQTEYYITMIEDITSRKEAEMNLNEYVNRLRLAARAARVAMWDWDLLKDELYLSPEWKAQLGYGDDELESSYAMWVDLLHPEDRERVIALVDAYLRRDEEEYLTEFRLRHKDGSYRWIYVAADHEVDKAGRMVRLYGCHIDVTEQKELVKILKETLPRNIAINLDFEKGLPQIKGDPTQIHQVFLNLLVNARDAMPEGGQVTITVKAGLPADSRKNNLSGLPDKVVCIEVSDTGVGVPEEIAERIFDPFFTTKERGEGILLVDDEHAILQLAGVTLEERQVRSGKCAKGGAGCACRAGWEGPRDRAA